MGTVELPCSVVRSRRRRGVVLTSSGLARLFAARQGHSGRDGTSARPSQEWLAERSGLSVRTVARILRGQASVDRQSLEALFQVFGLSLEPGDCLHPEDPAAAGEPRVAGFAPTIDWGEAPLLGAFHGRQQELATLSSWLEAESGCRLISVLGLGGIGKTTLVTRLLQGLAPDTDFQAILWRSVRNAPRLESLLREWLSRLAPDPAEGSDLDRFLSLIRERRCLFVLDNFETLLDAGVAGSFRPDYDDYGELVRLFAETSHRSLLILTSREKPLELERYEGGGQGIETMRLSGSREAARALLDEGDLQGSAEQRRSLEERCGHSPLAVKIVAAAVNELFGGDIGAFLRQEAILLGGLRPLLERQFERLSGLERTLMSWLAIRRDWTSLEELFGDLVPPMPRGQVLLAMQGLQRRSLVERRGDRFTQQPVVMEFAGERLVEEIAEAIAGGREPGPLHAFALLQTTVSDHIRMSQTELLLGGVVLVLRGRLGSRQAVVARLRLVLDGLAQAGGWPGGAVEASYAAGNLLNLLHHLDADLSGVTLTALAVRHAYLPNVPLPGADLSHADLSGSVLTKTFGAVFAVAFHPDGERFATGEITGRLRLWSLRDDPWLWSRQAAPQWLWAISFSPDGTLLAAAGGGQVVTLWDSERGQLVRELAGHGDQVHGVGFDPAGGRLAAAGGDGTVRVWRVADGEPLLTLVGHQGPVAAVGFCPRGEQLFSGGADGTLRIWDGASGEPIACVAADRADVRCLAVDPLGRWIATGGGDGLIRLWCMSDRHLLETLPGHQSHLVSLSFSRDGALLASSSTDHSVRLWEMPSGKPVATLNGPASWLHRVCFSPDGRSLLCGGSDYSVRHWAVPEGTLLRRWVGYCNWMWWADYSPDGRWIVSAGGDRTVRIWDAQSECLQRTLRGHHSWVLSAVFSASYDAAGSRIASAGEESIHLWEAASGRRLATLRGHRGEVLCLQWSPTAPLLASGGSDYSLRLWDPVRAEAAGVLSGHRDWVRSLAFDPRGSHIATGSHDRSVRLWDVASGTCALVLDRFEAWVWGVAFTPDGHHLVTASGTDLTLWDLRQASPVRPFRAHTSWIRTIAVSRDGHWLASGSSDGAIHIWDLSSGELLSSCTGHGDQVLSVRFSPDGERLVSGSADETVRVWERTSGRTVATLRTEGLYAGTRITGVTGLAPSALESMRALGAIEA
ncbi:NACHT domain-containing protein [Synechococcus sp. CBW1107]|uniref:NACHT domain-containing protein n=1 Tax=Synechococcus sp. CBW1107 TaxID=2789857 RepID=UPI002AD33051|nr:NACHT domain-containing protein [Synechococcus sp. CBW1107]